MAVNPINIAKSAVKRVANRLGLWAFQLTKLTEPRYDCPICRYRGPFREADPGTPAVRKHAACANCGSLERHRLQWLVLESLRGERNFSDMRALHFAPESFFHERFKKMFRSYATVDLYRGGVDIKSDITALPFGDGAFDIVYASHVLEHVRDDNVAIAEIRRVLAPSGIAVLPVPYYSLEKTVEYPRPFEYGHVRAPGRDYYERYERAFSQVQLHTSNDFPDHNQVFVYEDLSIYPTEESPMRPPVSGTKHIDIVPVCEV